MKRIGKMSRLSRGAINHITALLNEMALDFQETPQGQGFVLTEVTPGE